MDWRTKERSNEDFIITEKTMNRDGELSTTENSTDYYYVLDPERECFARVLRVHQDYVSEGKLEAPVNGAD